MNPPVAKVACAAKGYAAWGLPIRSELLLPEAVEAAADGVTEPAIEIGFGAVPASLAGATAGGVCFQRAPDALLLRVDGVARYLAEAGRRVTIARAPGTADEDVRLFLLGTVFGALLAQRGDLVLRGSAVDLGGTAAVFLGASGVGKSTLAAALHDRGHAVLTDDIAVLRRGGDGRCVAFPALPRLNLWPDVLTQLGRDPGEFPRLRAALEKRAVRIGPGFAAAPLPLGRVYVLSVWNRAEVGIEPLAGVAGLAPLRAHRWEGQFDGPERGAPAEFEALLQLARQARVAVIRRPMEAFPLEKLAAAIVADAKA